MKKIYLIIIGLFALMLLPNNVFASSGSINVSASSTNVKVGDTVNVTVTFKANSGIGGYYMSLVPSNSSVLSANSGLVLDGLVSGTPTTNSHNLSFKAINTGSCTFSVSVQNNGDFVDSNGDGVNYSFSSVTINVSEATYEDVKKRPSTNNNATKKDIKPANELSSNNFLSSLSIEGIELTPEFDKEHLEYSATLNELKDKIVINAEAEDEDATIEGIGEVAVSDGENKLEVKVIAANGEEKVYIIHLEIKDGNTINVKVGNKKLIVIKNKDLLKMPKGFTETVVKINGIEVPGFINKKTKIILVGLKDEKGNINLYAYKNGKYEEFNNIESSMVNLYIKNYNKTPRGFIKTNIIVGKKKYSGYKYKNDKNIILFYATDLETGKSGYYQYDKDLNTFIKYNSSIVKDIYKYKLITIAAISVAVLIIFINLITVIRKGKKKKKKKREKESIEI